MWVGGPLWDEGFLEPRCVQGSHNRGQKQLPLPVLVPPPSPRDALEGEGPQGWPQKRSGRQLEGVAKAVGGGYCRLQIPLRLALAVRGTVAGHRLGGLEGGVPPPLPMRPCPLAHDDMMTVLQTARAQRDAPERTCTHVRSFDARGAPNTHPTPPHALAPHPPLRGRARSGSSTSIGPTGGRLLSSGTRPPPPPCPPGPLSYQGSIAAGHTHGGAKGARKFFPLPT